jgi:hypothetical protein
MGSDRLIGVGVLRRLDSYPGFFLAAAIYLLAITPAHALETDQFFAWGKPIEDSTDYLDAWVRYQVEYALEPGRNGTAADCDAAVDKIQKRLQHSIYQPIEIWITATDLVDRVPKSVEENSDYHDSYLLSKTYPLDWARIVQPSPTVQVSDIRLGSDKLSHFFSAGWWYYHWWRKNGSGKNGDELQQQLAQAGFKLEKWIHGMFLTGVVSPADMEANLQGFLFYHRLCHGDQPYLSRVDDEWIFSPEYTIADYVSPAWDESWNANIYGRHRWKGIRKTMTGYCPLLDSPWVREQRARYEKLDTGSPIDQAIENLVKEGELDDPMLFDITTVCELESQERQAGN